ncbi:MAG: MBL fold metallo-hydrolase [Gammaproteobacteria bacterium]|jgi:glyoxylase-like metal-dependent hydrolase (beta-lactamase superfamily II)
MDSLHFTAQDHRMTQSNDEIIRYPQGIAAIDTGYVRPHLDASHLIMEGDRAAFVDTGTAHSVPRLLAALDALGVEREDVSYVLVTHVHLDHAGGAGALMRELPRAKCVVHPRGARHLVDPDKLVAGTKAVYGEDEFDRLYGEVVPIPAERVIEVNDGDSLSLAGRTLEFIHTPGHALHHYCILDPEASVVFAGDTFGISYREFDSERGAFIFPATTPVHFDPDAAHDSIDRIMDFGPEAIFLTHYSRVTDLDRLASDLHAELDACVDIATGCANAQDRIACIADNLLEHLLERLEDHGCELPRSEQERLLAMDVDLNAQGLVVWLNRLARQG